MIPDVWNTKNIYSLQVEMIVVSSRAHQTDTISPRSISKTNLSFQI